MGKKTEQNVYFFEKFVKIPYLAVLFVLYRHLEAAKEQACGNHVTKWMGDTTSQRGGGEGRLMLPVYDDTPIMAGGMLPYRYMNMEVGLGKKAPWSFALV